MIAVIDYNMGNLQSVQNAFLKIGKKIDIVKDSDKLKKYDKIILPGVGAFGDAMIHLKKTNMDQAIKEASNSGKFILGICLGMQLLLSKSEEFGNHKGLDLIKGEVKKFDKTKFDTPLKVPHMGWNEIFIQKDTPLFKDLADEFYLYFVHSYHVECEKQYITGITKYGYDFVSAINKDNIFGLQPHPEKSHDTGLKILKNFTEI